MSIKRSCFFKRKNIIELKIAKIKWQILHRGSTSDLSRKKKELVKLKIDQLELDFLSRRYNKEQRKILELLGHYQVYPHTCNGNTRREVREKASEIFSVSFFLSFNNGKKSPKLKVYLALSRIKKKKKKIHTQKCYNQTVKSQGQRGDLEKTMRKMIHH